MPLLLATLLVVEAASGFACVRAREYRHALGLGVVVVPLSLLCSALSFRAADGHTEIYHESTALSITVGLISLLVATIATVWMAVTAVRASTRQGEQ